MKKIASGFSFICIASLFIFFSSCSADRNGVMTSLPGAFGERNHLAVIADEELWEGAVGDTFQYYFSSAYPILPQPEPILDVVHYTPSDLGAEPPRKELRTILFLGDLSDENSTTTNWIKNDIGKEKLRRVDEDPNYNTTLGYDKWAKGQTLIYLFGKDKEELKQNIKNRFPAIYKKIHDKDRELIEANTYPLNKRNQILTNIVKKTIGVNIELPAEYFLALNDSTNQFVWIRGAGETESYNLMFKKMKYEDKSIFTKEGVKAIRDTLGRKYVSTAIEDTYMLVNDVDLPMVTSTTDINGNYTFEARGIWEIENDFMGGPFVSYLILKPDTDQLVFVDGFIHAPNKEKREFMQKLEYIFSTITFD